jgi:hypothetical protein
VSVAPISSRSGHETRRAALNGFMDLFEPGDIVDIATGTS